MFKNERYYNLFSIWLLSLLILVAIIIIVGGLTRLTDSGLSITKWELFTGLIPPLNQDQWERYFLEYKSIPQYIYLNSGMTLQEFKVIFLWEYFHRILGRVIGLFFFIPFMFFLFKKLLNKYLTKRLIGISLLILLQGFVGWFMVQSGLTNNVTVSHYRLSLHLFIAFIIFSSLFWIYMNHHFEQNKNFFQINTRFIFIKILIFFIFLQIIIGAFVSGLNAGKLYQTWPLMNGSYFPSDNFVNNLFNFKDPSFVQFLHRNIAYLIFIISIYAGFFIYKNKFKELYNSYITFIFFIGLQILLGILVLFSNVDIYFASLHQISSIFLVVSSLNLYFRSIRSN
mgnify:CR=1 FL=1